jgi:hypothetical protein
MTKWYKKELPDQAVYISGRPYKFDFMATSDPWLINEFDSAIRHQSGGIVEITQAQYDESIKKKQQSPSPFNSPWRQEIRAPQFNPAQPARAAVVVGDAPPPRNGHLGLPSANFGQAPAPAEPITVTPPRVFLPTVAKAPPKK